MLGSLRSSNGNRQGGLSRKSAANAGASWRERGGWRAYAKSRQRHKRDGRIGHVVLSTGLVRGSRPCASQRRSGELTGIALSHLCDRRRTALAPQGPRKLAKLDVAGSTPVARSREVEHLAADTRHRRSLVAVWQFVFQGRERARAQIRGAT